MGSGVAGRQNKGPSPGTPASPGGVGAPGVEELPLPPRPALKLGGVPQVQELLWSTELPNVLISAANAAGGQEDGARLSEGMRAAQ